jgi:hypothetical protein
LNICEPGLNLFLDVGIGSKFEDTIGWKQNESVNRRRIDNIMTKWRSTKNIILVKYWYSMGTWTILVTKINLILWMYTDEEFAKLDLVTLSDIFIFHYIQSTHVKYIGYNFRVPHSLCGMWCAGHCRLDGDGL